MAVEADQSVTSTSVSLMVQHVPRLTTAELHTHLQWVLDAGFSAAEAAIADTWNDADEGVEGIGIARLKEIGELRLIISSVDLPFQVCASFHGDDFVYADTLTFNTRRDFDMFRLGQMYANYSLGKTPGEADKKAKANQQRRQRHARKRDQ
jgi:hypothetical protein